MDSAHRVVLATMHSGVAEGGVAKGALDIAAQPKAWMALVVPTSEAAGIPNTHFVFTVHKDERLASKSAGTKKKLPLMNGR